MNDSVKNIPPERTIPLIEHLQRSERQYGQSAQLISALAEGFVYEKLEQDAPYSEKEKRELLSLQFEVDLEIDRISNGISGLCVALELCFDTREGHGDTLGPRPMRDIAELMEIASGLIVPLSTLTGQISIALAADGKGGVQ